MAGLGKLTIGLPTTPRAWLWPAVSIVCALGVLISLVHLGGVSQSERKRALDASQRFTINPATGAISLAKKPTTLEGVPAATKETPSEKPTEATPPVTPAATETPEKPAEKPAEPPAEPKPEGAAPPTDASAEHATESAPTPAPAAATVEPTPAPTAAPASPATSAPPASETPKPAATTQPAPASSATTPAPSLRTMPLVVQLTAPTRTKDSLVIAPAPEVSEKVGGQVLPRMGGKGVVPSKIYARPFHRTSDQVLLSFVVLDGGLDTQSIGLMLALPQEVTIAYSPYAKGENYGEHLRAGGHELWAMLPTMNEGYPANDPGPMGLVNRMPPEEIQRRVQLVMAAVPGSVGLVLPYDETISQYKDSLKPVMAEVSKRGLLMLQANPARNIEQVSADPELKPLLTKANLVLDADADEAQIRSKLSGLVDAVQENREYVVVLSARPQTLQILNEWLHETSLEKPLTLAPLSAVYQPLTAPEEVASDKKEATKKKPKAVDPKKQKSLPQDQYLKPQGDKKEGGGHGGEKKPEGEHH